MAKLSKNNGSLKDRAAAIKQNKAKKKLTLLLMNVIAVLVAMTYIVSILYNKFGSFTVSINKTQQLQYGLSLSETKDFARPTSNLNCNASAVITNIDGKSLDNVALGIHDGVDNGLNYICYTFYCRNTGQEAVNMEYQIVINKMTLAIEKAARIRLITKVNDENPFTVDYADAAGLDERGNPIPEMDPYETTPFYSKSVVMSKMVENFQVGDTIKFTVVLWLEGNDPECVDDVLGGEFKIDMKFNCTPISGGQEVD